MFKFTTIIHSILCCLCLLSPTLAHSTIRVVAAENVYGAIAKELGQDQVQVTSILNNPNQDPHLFSAKPSTSKAVGDADLLIFNGADYDPWFNRLLSSKAKNNRVIVINVGQLVNAKAGANPHLWYRLAYVRQVAIALTHAYQQQDPSQTALFTARLQNFLKKLQRLDEQVDALKKHVHGLAVTATEPVAAYLVSDLGLVMLDEAFQLAVMNDAEPSAQSRALFEQHLKNKQVHLLIYNQQVQDPVTKVMRSLAQQQNISIVGVSELLPPEEQYNPWYQHMLDLFSQALLSH
jgi:zinc/manganese transport system substrate-binding protein